jgi:hypothetical protein
MIVFIFGLTVLLVAAFYIKGKIQRGINSRDEEKYRLKIKPIETALAVLPFILIGGFFILDNINLSHTKRDTFRYLVEAIFVLAAMVIALAIVRGIKKYSFEVSYVKKYITFLTSIIAILITVILIAEIMY